MKHKLLRLVDKLFRNMLRLHYVVPSVEWSFCNMRKLGFDPKFIMDIGAFDGDWAALASGESPNASILMLEAQEHKRPILEEGK
ncbi:hypothetical protein EBX31_08505 [bacterium]|nr:hypothetical protein [bacterium]